MTWQRRSQNVVLGLLVGGWMAVLPCAGQDCNANGVGDAVDIAGPTSTDCNTNNVPDECDLQPPALAISPIRYDIINGEQGSFTYFDDTYTGSGNRNQVGAQLTGGLGQLTDGAIGGNDWAANLGNGSAYEWIGWNSIQPTITFDFGSVVDLVTMGIHSNNVASGGVSLWGTAQITFSNDGSSFGNQINYTTSAAERANTTARFIDIPLNRSARYVRVFLLDGNQEWIFISEARFTAIVGTSSEDCNSNGQIDDCEILAGTSTDCDVSGSPDLCDLAAGSAEDCNTNLLPDTCDIAAGTSDDCDTNDAPDECDLADAAATDCNANAVLDSCDILGATSADCNGNGYPDTCDLAGSTSADCNTNDVPDGCDYVGGTSADCESNGVPDECDLAAATHPDCNTDDVPDVCDINAGTSEDCDGSGTPDECDLAAGTSEDCNTNDIPDACDLAGGTAEDCNANSVLDVCDLAERTSPDCNTNAVPDECDIAGVTSLDCNTNAVPDECDLTGGTSGDCNTNTIPDECDSTQSVGSLISPIRYAMFNGESGSYPYLDQTYNGSGNPSSNGSALSGGLGQLTDGVVGVDDWQANLGNGNAYEWVGWNTIQPTITFEFAASLQFSQVSIHANNYNAVGGSDVNLFGTASISFSDNGVNYSPPMVYTTSPAQRADGTARYIHIPVTGGGRFVRLTLTDGNGNWVFISEVRFAMTASIDCNSNLVPDECELEFGSSVDCNANLLPDECEIAVGSSAPGGPFYCTIDCADDCNANAVPDECEPDCNGNGVADSCDIAGTTSTDCDTTGIPDDCEIGQGSSPDCNANAVPDACDIAGVTSPDCDGNGVPDDCQPGSGDYAWTGASGGAFGDAGNWSPAGGPGTVGRAELLNTSGQDNACVLDTPGETAVCSVLVAGSAGGRQILAIEFGSGLRLYGGMVIEDGGELRMRGGRVQGGTVLNLSNTLSGYGEVASAVVNQGLMSGEVGQTLKVSGPSLENTVIGLIRGPLGGVLHVTSSDVEQSGAVEIQALAGMAFDGPLVNRSGATISILGGALGADGLTNEVDADVAGFGTIQSNVNNDGRVTVFADMQLVGDVVNEGVVTIQNGTLTVMGSLSGSGQIIGGFGGRGGDACGAIRVGGDLRLSEGAYAQLGCLTVVVEGDVDLAASDAALDWVEVSLVMDGRGEQRLEVASRDCGQRGDVAKRSFKQLRVGSGSEVRLVDSHDNAPGTGREALYVDELTIVPEGMLDLAGHRVYCRSASDASRRGGIIDSKGGGGVYHLR